MTLRPLPAWVALAAALLLTPATSRAYFEELAVDARGIAMGTSTLAAAQGASAYYWNPAGLAGLEAPQALVDYGKPYAVPDLNANTLALATRWRGTGFAGAWHRLGVAHVYAEDQFTLAAGRTVATFGAGHRLALGAALKVGRVGFETFEDPQTLEIIDFGSQTRATFDLAARWSTPWRVDIAWVGRDLTSPRYELVSGSGGAQLPARQELALAFRWNRESTVTAGLSEIDALGHYRFNLGLEIWFYRVFAIRSGLTNVSQIYSSTGSPTEFQFTGGFGITDRGWSLDAAALTNRDLGASYRMSLTLPLTRGAKP